MPISKSTIDKELSELRRLTKTQTEGANKRIKRLYKQLLKDLNAFLGDTYIKYADGDGRLDFATLQAKAYYANFISEVEKRVSDITPETSKQIKNTVKKVYSTCYDGMVKAVENAAKDNSIPLNLGKTNIQSETLKRAVENPVSGLTLSDILEKNRREVIYDIKTAINIGLINGLRYETMAKNITDKLDISYNKALNITSTETHRVQESGLLDSSKRISSALENYGLVETVTWRTMKDEKVRPQRRTYTKKRGWSTKIVGQANHVKMEGVTIRAGEKFKLEPGVETESPGNSGVARHDCRCRCYLEYNLMTAEEFEELTGRKVDKNSNMSIIKSGSEKMALENQRYGRNKSTLVNKTYIDSGEYRKKFDRATNIEKVNKSLYDNAKTALKHRSGTVYEDMYWIDGKTGEVLLSITDSTEERAIVYTDKIKNVVSSSNNIITLHTHPSSMPPSASDLNSCFSHNYKKGFIACHDGKVFGYTSNELINERLYDMYIQSFIKSGYNDYEAQINALKKLSKSYDIDVWEVI